MLRVHLPTQLCMPRRVLVHPFFWMGVSVKGPFLQGILQHVPMCWVGKEPSLPTAMCLSEPSTPRIARVSSLRHNGGVHSPLL